MTDFMDQYATQFRSAAAALSRRRARVALVPLAVAGLAAAAVAVNVVATRPDKPVGEVETAPPVTRGGGGYAEQRELLGALRDPAKRDRDPQVRQTLRDYRELGPRAGRLLGKAPSGSAYVLLATRFYNHTELRDREPVTTRRRDGLCLVRRGTQGGAGTCLGTAAVRAGDFHGAMGGEVFGVVPDGVTHVRPPRRDRAVRVRRNFYSYPAHGHPGPPPVWLDAEGNEVARKHPPASSSAPTG